MFKKGVVVEVIYDGDYFRFRMYRDYVKCKQLISVTKIEVKMFTPLTPCFSVSNFPRLDPKVESVRQRSHTHTRIGNTI